MSCNSVTGDAHRIACSSARAKVTNGQAVSGVEQSSLRRKRDRDSGPLNYQNLLNSVQDVVRTGFVIENGIVANWQLPEGDIEAWRAYFSLPGCADKHDALKQLHPFMRDDRIEFQAQEHVNLVDGRVAPISVTAFLAYFHEYFDPDAAIAKMKAGKGWPQRLVEEFTYADGREWADGEIKTMWDQRREEASGRGTLMHWYIEQYLNGQTLGQPQSPEFKMFQMFENEFLKRHGIRTLRTELSIFHCGLGIAGQVDFVGLLPSGGLIVVDWKRSKRIVGENQFQCMRPPLDHLDDCNLTHYNLQVNLYSFILESEYELHVHAMYLCVLHPLQSSYILLEVPSMRSEIEAISQHVMARYGSGVPVPGQHASFNVNENLRSMRM